MKQTKFLLMVVVAAIVFLPLGVLAQTMNSTNYSVENPQVDVGGESSSSANYNSMDSIGGEGDTSSSSTNYKGFWGFLFQAYPGVPATPTLTNTGGTLYNSLDFVVATGGNSASASYAIAISSDNFTTTNYIQANDTVGTSAVWQTYSAWGSSTGQRVTGLLSGTTYKIKVKARYGIDSESGFSATASAATTSPTITVSFAGVNSGNTVAGAVTTITSSSNAIAYASLPVGGTAVAAQTITVSTNATGGYTTTVAQDGNLRKANGDNIAAVTAPNSAPAAWPTGITNGRFGYHTTDSNLCTGTSSRFSTNDTYAAATTTPTEVACNTAAVTNEATSLVFKVGIGNLQQAGSYTNALTYITTAQY